jgi:hypothetical protein
MRGRAPALLLLAALVAALTLAGPLGPARGAVITDRPLLFGFDGSDTTAGSFDDVRNSIDVDQASGDIYVVDGRFGNAVIDRFDAAGVAQPFSSTGKSSLELPNGSGLAIDNSGANPGRIYLSRGVSGVEAFDPAGNLLWELEKPACSVAVDTAGHPWITALNSLKVSELASSGSPPAEVSSFKTEGSACRLDIDASDNVYLQEEVGGTLRIDKYTAAGAFDSPLDSTPSIDVAVDQSSAAGHLFTVHGNSTGLSRETFNEYDAAGNLLGSFGRGVINNAHGIVYNHALDRVYVADASGNKVFAFGSVATGTVPDATTEPVTGVGISKATFNGEVNPQSVPNAYFFEWQEGDNPVRWGMAKSSTPQPLPEDSADHPVSFDASQLAGGTLYSVRLVGLNTANGLRSVSDSVTFTTEVAASAPDVTIEDATSITDSSAQLNATVNPKQDFGTEYRFQIGEDPACTSGVGFTNRPPRGLESEANAPVAASEEATGLVPAQHYCVRVVAENSAGSVTSAIKEFTTKAIPATEAQTAFIAPRLDISARLNARVNPEGVPFNYRFEVSEDGASWTALPQREDTSGAREQVVVGEELEGLKPATTYHYRLASVENGAGQTPGLPAEERTFTTRSSAEVHSPSPCPNEAVREAQHTASYLPNCRGIELVNAPDKGNQNVSVEVEVETSPLSADGERAVWNVKGGAPGGNAGAGAAFLSERTGPTTEFPNGWSATAILPPAKEQFEGGEAGAYSLRAITPELSSFLFNAGAGIFFGLGKTLVRLDADQNQTVLAQYQEDLRQGGQADLSDDGAHVLFVDLGGTHQLQDIGTGKAEAVSFMPDGLSSGCGLDTSDQNESFVGGGGGGSEAASKQWRPGYHMIATTDASRVYFQAKPNRPDGGQSRQRQTRRQDDVDRPR